MSLKRILPIWYFLVLVECSQVHRNNSDEDGSKLIRIVGDVIFGGIFPMHEHRVPTLSVESPCGAVKEEKGVQRLEAMLYALDLINSDNELLPNTTLGALILDSCSSDTYALDQSMEFVRSYMNQDISEYKCESGKSPLYVPHKPVTGVIGASFSGVSIMVANILRLFKIPQVSYASTSTELSDKSRFEYFSRVVPPDNFQAQAMVEVVHELGWKYVSTVAVEGDYGEKGIASFIALAAIYNICVAVSEKILRNAKAEDFERIVDRLSSKPNARAVVLFVDEDNIRKLLHATIKANRTGHFMWIGSDSWGAKVHPVKEQEFAAEGAITILPFKNSLEGFDKYYNSLRPRMDNECGNQAERNVEHPALPGKIVNCRNLWFREFWQQHHKCTFGPKKDNKPQCTGREQLKNYEQEGLVPFVVDAVYAMAHGIHNLIEDVCVETYETEHYLCDSLKPAPRGQQLLQYIRNVTFVGRQGTEIRFNADGDAYGFYNIYQYQRSEDGRFNYTLIGTWKEVFSFSIPSMKKTEHKNASSGTFVTPHNRLDFDVNMTQWATGSGELHIPRSTCSDDCPLGHVRNFQEACCWSCVQCPQEAYVFNDSCQRCADGYAPNDNKTGCIKVTPEVIPWTSPWAIVPLAYASIGIFSTLFTTAVFIRYNRTPVIMASGRELCYVLLVGILSCYGMSFVILSKPTFWNCTYLRIGLGLCLSICYSAILTKTNRISRIFNEGRRMKRPSFTSPKSQVAITIGLTAVQLVGAIFWLLIEPPDTKEIHPYPLTAVLTCRVSTFSLMMSLVYNMFLILMCTLYAFKTRKIPENFNEAKYIGFTMYSTCIVWLAFVPIYFGTNNDYKIQIASMCMCINISATVALGCLLSPKVYLVLFQPYKNVRSGQPHTSGTQGTQRPAYSMRFTAVRSQTMMSVTSGSRSSPPPTLPRVGSRSGGEPKHANEHRATDTDGSESPRNTMHKTGKEVYGAKKNDEEEDNECKLSTVPELPELTDASSPPTHTFRSNQDLNEYRNGSFTNSMSAAESMENVDMEIIPSISEKVASKSPPVDYTPEDQILHSVSPTYSEISSQ